jgi:hypothetical protein
MAWFVLPSPVEANPGHWRHEWPKTDFGKYAVRF